MNAALDDLDVCPPPDYIVEDRHLRADHRPGLCGRRLRAVRLTDSPRPRGDPAPRPPVWATPSSARRQRHPDRQFCGDSPGHRRRRRSSPARALRVTHPRMRPRSRASPRRRGGPGRSLIGSFTAPTSTDAHAAWVATPVRRPRDRRQRRAGPPRASRRSASSFPRRRHLQTPVTFTVTDSPAASAIVVRSAVVSIATPAPAATFTAPKAATAGDAVTLSLTGAFRPPARPTARRLHLRFSTGGRPRPFGPASSLTFFPGEGPTPSAGPSRQDGQSRRTPATLRVRPTFVPKAHFGLPGAGRRDHTAAGADPPRRYDRLTSRPST